MLKIVDNGIIFRGNLYEMSKGDSDWIVGLYWKNPVLAYQNIKSVAHTIYPVEE